MTEKKETSIHPTLVVLAAGMGSRYGGLKQVDPMGPYGETIIDYSVFDAMRAGFGKVVFVIRKSIEKDFLETFANRFLKNVPYEIVFQELDLLPGGEHCPDSRTKPWGTVHAIWVCREIVKEPFVVINADDFYGREAFETLASFLKNNKEENPQSYAMCVYNLGNTLSEHGSVTRGICKVTPKGYLESVDEQTNIEIKASGEIISYTTEHAMNLAPELKVSMNMWAFNPSFFPLAEKYFLEFLKARGTEQTAEFVTPQLVDILIRKGEGRVRVLQSPAQWFGITYAEDKPMVIQKLKKLAKKKEYPEKLWK